MPAAKPNLEKTEINNHVQRIKGTVVKLCSKDTIRIETKITKTHPVYKKRYTVSRFYLAHDPKNAVKLGDQIVIEACKPISKQKHFVVLPGLTELTD